MNLTALSLQENILRGAALTAGQAGLETNDILEIATERMITELVPLIKTRWEGYLQKSQNIPLVAGKSTYRLPSRALGQAFHAIHLTKNDGSIYQLTRLDITETYNFTGVSNEPIAYSLIGGTIQLFPAIGTNPTSSLTFIFTFRPSKIVPDSSAKKIISVNENTVTLPSISSKWSSTVKFDFVSKNANEIIAWDVGVVDISSPVMTFDIDLAGVGVEAGDWICQSGESPVPMIPEDLHPLLVEMSIAKISEIRTDVTRSNQARERITSMLSNLDKLIDRRVTSEIDVIRIKSPFLPRLR